MLKLKNIEKEQFDKFISEHKKQKIFNREIYYGKVNI